MKRTPLYYLILLVSSIIPLCPAFAQDEILIDSSRNEVEIDTSWKKKVEFGANLNQGSFSSNWTGGAVNSIAVGAHLNAMLKYEKGRNSWRNDFQTQYSILRNKGQESRKSVDRLFFDTKYGREVSEYWSLIANLNFLSQFTPGYDYDESPSGELVRRKVSGLFSPAYLTEAIGIEYRPTDYFFLSFSPGAIRQTIVSDLNLYKTFPKNYGVPIGQRVRTEVALMQLVANFDKSVAKNLNLKFRYQLFANYKNLGAIDHRLDANFMAKINKYWNVNLGAILIYDQDQSLDIQLAQSLSIGFLYTF